MKLLTHNFISSRFLKNVNNGYPLRLHAVEVITKDVEYNEDFMKSICGKIDYDALRQACESINEAGNLPEVKPTNFLTDPEFLKELHRVLFCIEIIKGDLECPETQRKFPIHDGIPNLLVNDNE